MTHHARLWSFGETTKMAKTKRTSTQAGGKLIEGNEKKRKREDGGEIDDIFSTSSAKKSDNKTLVENKTEAKGKEKEKEKVKVKRGEFTRIHSSIPLKDVPQSSHSEAVVVEDTSSSLLKDNQQESTTKKKKRKDGKGGVVDGSNMIGEGPDEEELFADSRGNKRLRTEDGLPIYSVNELNIGQGGDTPSCPFDCDCCF